MSSLEILLCDLPMVQTTPAGYLTLKTGLTRLVVGPPGRGGRESACLTLHTLYWTVPKPYGTAQTTNFTLVLLSLNCTS